MTLDTRRMVTFARMRIISVAVLAGLLAIPAPAGAAFGGRNGRIYFAAGFNGPSIWSIKADGTSPRLLSPDDGSHDSDPSVSPDGTLVAYHRWWDSGHDILLMSHTGDFIANLTAATNLPARNPEFSADGKSVYFDTRSRIYRVDLDDLKLTHVTAGHTFDWVADVATNSSGNVVFEASVDGSYDLWELYQGVIQNVTESPELPEGEDGWSRQETAPDISPTGLLGWHEAYVDEHEHGQYAYHHFCVVTSAGVHCPTYGINEGGNFSASSFSPDGRRIVTVQSLVAGPLWTVGVDGSAPQRITGAGKPFTMIAYSPDWGPTPDVTPPAATVSVPSAVDVSDTGWVPARVTCGAAEPSCVGTAKAIVKVPAGVLGPDPETLSLGKKLVDIDGGAARVFKFTLTPKAEEALAEADTLPATVTVVLTDAAGNVAKFVRKTTLTP